MPPLAQPGAGPLRAARVPALSLNPPLTPLPVHWPPTARHRGWHQSAASYAFRSLPPSRRLPANQALAWPWPSQPCEAEPMTGEDGRSGAGGGEPEASPPPGSKSGGRRARMWRVTLNCSGSQTPRLPARPPAARFPAKAQAHPKQRSASPLLAAGRRVRPLSPARHTAWVRATGDTAPLPFPGDAQRDGRCSPTRPPRPLVSSPLRPSIPGRPSRHYLGAAPSGRHAASSSFPCARSSGAQVLGSGLSAAAAAPAAAGAQALCPPPLSPAPLLPPP